jgi:hypothetical protein
MYEMNAKTTDATDYIQKDVLSLRIKNERLEQEKCELLGIIQGKDNVIKDLEWQLQEVAKDNDNYQAENKELKERFKRAKEIIKGLLHLKSTASSVQDIKNRFSVREKAEEFLKEEE